MLYKLHFLKRKSHIFPLLFNLLLTGSFSVLSSILSFSLRLCNSSPCWYHLIKHSPWYNLDPILVPALRRHIIALPRLGGSLQSYLFTQCQNRKILCLLTLHIFRTCTWINSLFHGTGQIEFCWLQLDLVTLNYETYPNSFLLRVCVCLCTFMRACVSEEQRSCES